MDSTSSDAAPAGLVTEKTEAAQCAKHGDVQVRFHLVNGRWVGGKCLTCDVEETVARREADEREKQRREQEVKMNRLKGLQKSAGIPARFAGRTFDNFMPPTDEARIVRDTCAAYAADFPAQKARGTSMTFVGEPGTGKTHLACAIGNEIIRQHYAHAVFTNVAAVCRRIKDTYRKGAKETEQMAIDWFLIPDLLIIDEVGVQFGTEAERYILFEVINGRYERLLPTILLSNLIIKRLKEYAGERVVDRMQENGGATLIFDWGSYRGKEARHDA